MPAERWRELKATGLAAYQAASPALARLAQQDFTRAYERELPSATACFLEDFEAYIARLRMPIAHRRVARTTNLLERLFGEERRRTKVIPHAFGERAVLKTHVRGADSSDPELATRGDQRIRSQTDRGATRRTR